MFHYVMHEIPVTQVGLPSGLANASHAYLVGDQRLFPVVRMGDVVCCGDPLPKGVTFPPLAVMWLPTGGRWLVVSLAALRPLATTFAVTYIIKR